MCFVNRTKKHNRSQFKKNVTSIQLPSVNNKQLISGRHMRAEVHCHTVQICHLDYVE